MNKYTFTVSAPGQIEMKDVTNSHVLHVNEGHAKYEWLLSNSGRVITIAESGRWNSSKDYNNYYGTKTVQTSGATETPVTVQLTKMEDIKIDDSLFTPMQTGTIFDKFVSTEGGLMPGTMIMAAGAPGIGKTTILLEMAAQLHLKGKKVLFISGEMNEMDVARYTKRFPNWSTLPILFLANYDQQSNLVIEQVLNQGWDLVLTDSWTEINESVKEHTSWTRGKCEKWILDLMNAHCKGTAGKFTTFITILQLNKGGVFSGSNRLKHMTSAMMNLDWDGKENSGRRYLEFSKNRMGEVGKKLYFSLNGGLSFDEARYQRDLFNDEILEAEAAAIEKEGHSFDRIFGLGNWTEETVEASGE